MILNLSFYKRCPQCGHYVCRKEFNGNYGKCTHCSGVKKTVDYIAKEVEKGMALKEENKELKRTLALYEQAHRKLIQENNHLTTQVNLFAAGELHG